MNIADMSEQTQDSIARTLFAAAFETTLEALRKEGIPNHIIVAAMLEIMTMVTKTLLGVEE